MVDGFAAYFAQYELSCYWFDIVDPSVLLCLPPQDIGTPERLADRKAVKDSSVHASTISDVAVYRKTEDARPDSHPENPEDEHTASFIDNKIAHYLGAVNGDGSYETSKDLV